MQHVISIVAPVFALIALGYIAGRTEWLSERGAKGLAEFTFSIAIPALLFRKMATAELPDTTPYVLWAAYFGTCAVIWALSTVMTLLVLRRSPAESASISMSAAFGNVVMIGMPLCLNLYGEAAAATIAVLVSLHSPALWLVASSHLALTRREAGASAVSILTDLFRELSRNAIILAIIAGSLWRLTGLGFAPLADQIIVLLGQAAVPCALIALGLSLVGFRIAGQVPTLTLILLLKIIVMPLVAWVIAYHAFSLPPVAAGVITIFAAMPTGANAYLFAERNGLTQHSASGAVALGTLFSAFSATAVIYFLS